MTRLRRARRRDLGLAAAPCPGSAALLRPPCLPRRKSRSSRFGHVGLLDDLAALLLLRRAVAPRRRRSRRGGAASPGGRHGWPALGGGAALRRSMRPSTLTPRISSNPGGGGAPGAPERRARRSDRARRRRRLRPAAAPARARRLAARALPRARTRRRARRLGVGAAASATAAAGAALTGSTGAELGGASSGDDVTGGRRQVGHRRRDLRLEVERRRNVGGGRLGLDGGRQLLALQHLARRCGAG